MNGRINLVENFGTDWIKYDDYEIKLTSTGEAYIAPSEESSFSMYNPFSVSKDLITSLIGIGDKAIKLEKEENENNKENLNKEILIFTKKYGLLGLISASVYNRNIVGDEKVLFIDNNHITKQKMMDESEYISEFMPFVEEGDVAIKKYKNCIDIVKREDSPKFYGKRPIILDFVFSKFYCEKLEWIIDFAKMISQHFNELLIYKNTNANLTENVTIMSGKFNAQKIGFTINQLDKTNIVWEFDSLKTAIETIYAFIVTDDKIVINRCKFCSKVFISSNIRAKYCSASCRNRSNVQKSRERKSSKLEVNEMGIIKEKRERLKEIYNEMKPDMGAYVIKNTANGKVLMNVSKDLKSTFNSQWFQLKMGSHMTKEMQKDWNKYGKDAFTFEVLEQLKYDEKGEKTDYSEELDILKMIWMEKLSKNESLEFYKK